MNNLWCRGMPRRHNNTKVRTQNFASQQERNNFTLVHKKVGLHAGFFYF